MNCREAHAEISAERDGALDDVRGAALRSHLAECADCRRARDALNATFSLWRAEVATSPVPDAEREWHAVRRRIRGGTSRGEGAPSRRRNFFLWAAVPLGAAAAVTLAFLRPTAPSTHHPAQTAFADAVEAPGNTSTMVLVDDKSGWVIVLASETLPKRG